MTRAPDRPPWGAITAFLLPALVVYTALTAYPVVRTFWNSLHKVLPNRSDEFVGLTNYSALLFHDDIFWRSVRNTLLWACASPLLEVGIALLLALALYAEETVGGRHVLLVGDSSSSLVDRLVGLGARLMTSDGPDKLFQLK